MKDLKIKPPICYVLPFYDPNTDTHISYLYDFLEYAGKSADIHLIVERSEAPDVDIANMKSITVQKMEFFPLRIVENFILLLGLRLKGCVNFYIHYSYISALNAGFITRVLFGQTWYWNCGMPWLYGKQYVLRLVLRTVDYLVTGTARMAELYSEHFGIPLWKIKVMPNWIDLKEVMSHPPLHKASDGHSESRVTREEMLKKLSIPEGKKVVLFVHRLSKRKGAHYLPDIAKNLPDNTVLLVVGDGPERENIESRIKNNELGEKIFIIGRAPQRDVINYFSIADVFIMPSEEEGFPHVLLEAMATGVPFVASDVGGVADIIPESMKEYVVADRRPEIFAKAVNTLLDIGDAERGYIKNEIARQVKGYDISVVQNIFIKLFQ